MSRKLYEIAVAKLRLGKVNCKYYHSNKLSDSILKCHCYKLLVNNFVLGLLSFVVAAFFVFNKEKKEVYDFLCLFHTHTYTHSCTHTPTHMQYWWLNPGPSPYWEITLLSLPKIGLFLRSVWRTSLIWSFRLSWLTTWHGQALKFDLISASSPVVEIDTCHQAVLQCHSIAVLTNWN